MTLFARRNPLAAPAIQRLASSRLRIAAMLLGLALLAVAIAACGTATGSAEPGVSGATATAAIATATPAPTASATAAASATPAPLRPAQLNAGDPFSILAWLFTPIFQVLFLLLSWFYLLTGNVVLAIVLLTVVIRLVTLRLSHRQIESQQRMYRLQPELRALQARYKGDRQALMTAQQEFYKERGVSPMAGCLPSVLQMGLLIPMYQVVRDIGNYNPSAMFSVFGVNLVPGITCPNPQRLEPFAPCINTVVAGIDMAKPQVLFDLNLGFFALGISVLAIASAILQAIQSRMVMPPPAENDPSAGTQRTMMYILPLFSLLYASILPAGLFIYWIVSSLFSIVQQYLIVGWGSIFPLFGRTPEFARNQRPRFPVTMPVPVTTGKSVAESRRRPEDRVASAAATVRSHPPRRGRQGRRGRRS